MTVPVPAPDHLAEPRADISATPPPDLLVHCGDEQFAVDAAAAPVTIGRDSAATVHLDYSWLSRTHLRLDLADGGWVAHDTSRNGIFVAGEAVTEVAVTDGLVIHLADADGLALRFEVANPDSDGGADVDPDIVRVGAAVARRRAELEITQRGLARDKIINAGALISFEKGRSWPHKGTRAKLEEVLRWSPGTIEAMRQGAAPARTIETTQALGGTTPSLLVRTITLALRSIDDAVNALPEAGQPGFQTRIDAILTDVRDLRGVAEEAAGASHSPAIELASALVAIRRRIDELMARAAQAPDSPLGPRLYTARRQRGLSIDDLALITRLPPQTIADAEAGRRIPPAANTALNTVLAQLH